MSDFISEGFYQNLIYDDRWFMLIKGLGVTIEIAFFAIILGVILGTLACLGRLSSNRVIRGIATAYVSFIRGTPTMTQLSLIYFGVFASVDVSKILVAVIAFGINSGAYMAEIFRGGILAVDAGQTEAGRSLGLNQWQTMTSIVFPQAVKNALPATANEFIVLIKEPAIVGTIAVNDLTKVANFIQSRTFNAWFPILSALVLYFVLTTILGKLLAMFERRLRVSDQR